MHERMFSSRFEFPNLTIDSQHRKLHNVLMFLKYPKHFDEYICLKKKRETGSMLNGCKPLGSRLQGKFNTQPSPHPPTSGFLTIFQLLMNGIGKESLQKLSSVSLHSQPIRTGLLVYF